MTQFLAFLESHLRLLLLVYIEGPLLIDNLVVLHDVLLAITHSLLTPQFLHLDGFTLALAVGSSAALILAVELIWLHWEPAEAVDVVVEHGDHLARHCLIVAWIEEQLHVDRLVVDWHLRL